jgi:serine/threonine protein kinase
MKKNKTLKGGRYIGEGSYGCVISPSIPCNEKKNKQKTKKSKLHLQNIEKIQNIHTIKTTVSKIIINPDEDTTKELYISKQLKDIDPEQKYFITYEDTCVLKKLPHDRSNSIRVKYTDDEIDNYIELENKKTDTEHCKIDLSLKPRNIVMQFGGYDLNEIVNIDFNKVYKKIHLKNINEIELHMITIYKSIFEQFKMCFKNLLTGLYKMHKFHIVNKDIKLENILANYDYKTDKVKMRFIDFGFSIKITPEYASHYSNFDEFAGTPEYMPPELYIVDVLYDYYNVKDDSYILKKIKSKINETTKVILVELKQEKYMDGLNDTILNLIKQIKNEFDKKTILSKYYGTNNNKLNGYLQKGDVYALGITMYELLNISYHDNHDKHHNKYIKTINVNNELKLHNLLKNMINPDPNKRYNILECLRHPYFS